jgi:hypothetical protein
MPAPILIYRTALRKGSEGFLKAELTTLSLRAPPSWRHILGRARSTIISAQNRIKTWILYHRKHSYLL